MATERKRHNRSVKRKIENGIISEEDAKWLFRRGNTSCSGSNKRKIEKGTTSEEDAKGLFRRWYTSPSESKEPRSKSWVSYSKEPVVKVENWHFKGEGKGGSLGLPVGSNGSVIAEAGKKGIPRALPANTEQDVQDMFVNGYYSYPATPFWDGECLWDVVHGTHCLWKNVPTGKKGGESTKVEFFHGVCHGWKDEDVIIS